MATRRIGVGVTVVNRLMYAVGGFDGVNRLCSVECYYPELNEWRYVAPMNCTRSGAGKSCVGKSLNCLILFTKRSYVQGIKKYQRSLHKSSRFLN